MKRIPKVIRWTPCFMMKWLGKQHAKHGEPMCAAHMNAWIKKGAVAYDKEVKEARSATKEAESMIGKDLHKIETMMSDITTLSNEEIKGRRKAQIKALSTRIWENIELIHSADRILEMRLREIMDALNYKLEFYKAGALINIKSHTNDVFPSTNLIETHQGYTIYRTEHDELEERVSEMFGTKADTDALVNNNVA